MPGLKHPATTGAHGHRVGNLRGPREFRSPKRQGNENTKAIAKVRKRQNTKTSWTRDFQGTAFAEFAEKQLIDPTNWVPIFYLQFKR